MMSFYVGKYERYSIAKELISPIVKTTLYSISFVLKSIITKYMGKSQKSICKSKLKKDDMPSKAIKNSRK